MHDLASSSIWCRKLKYVRVPVKSGDLYRGDGRGWAVFCLASVVTISLCFVSVPCPAQNHAQIVINHNAKVQQNIEWFLSWSGFILHIAWLFCKHFNLKESFIQKKNHLSRLTTDTIVLVLWRPYNLCMFYL